jgi:hypothetical protein
MDKWMNERGGAALLYVLMIAFVLMLVTPPLLTMTSTDSLRNKADHHTVAAANLAVSGMEAFIQYLDTYTNESGDRLAFVNGYSGKNLNYSLPDGTPISFTLTVSLPDTQSIVTVSARATAGNGSNERWKEIVYTINTSMPTPPANGGTPSGRYPVPETHQDIYVQGSYQNVPATVQMNTNLYQWISDVITKRETEVNNAITKYEEKAVICNCNSVDAITNAIQAGSQSPLITSSNPLILKVPNPIIMDGGTINWGTASKPVVLIMENVTYNKKAVLHMTGDLVLKQALVIGGNHSEINLLQSGSAYGNLYTLGSFIGNNTMSVTVPGLLYVGGNMTFNNKTQVTAGEIVVKGTFTVNNNTTLNADMDIVTGSVVVDNNSEISSTSGDFLIQNNFLANQNVDLSAGGVIAAGGDFTINGNNSSIKTGGGSTSLPLMEETAPDPEPGSANEVGWNPERQ